MNCALYIRCSTDHQQDSPQVQEATLRQYCAREGHTIAAVYTDEAVSGGTLIENRPAFKQLLVDRKQLRIEAVVILKIDRLSRDLYDFLGFQKAAQRHKLPILYAAENYDDSPTGNMMMQITAMFAEHERKVTGERIRMHNRHLAQIGKWPSGRPPLGYTYDKKTKALSVDEDRVYDAITVFETFLATNGNRRMTAQRLNAQGIRTRDGNLWSDDTVGDLLKNPLYRGIIKYQEIETEIDLPRIIPESIYERVMVLLDNTKFMRVMTSRQVYPYSGLLHCANCGNTYKVHRGNRKSSYTYVCRGKYDKGICGAPAIGSQSLDKLVGIGLETALRTELDNLRKTAQEQAESPALAGAINAAMRRQATLKESRKRAVDFGISGLISREDMEERLKEIDAQLRDIVESKPAVTMTPEYIEDLLQDWTVKWATWDDAIKRSLVLATCSRIFIRRGVAEKHIITLETCLSAGNIELKSECSQPSR